MDAESTVLAYYEALRNGDPLPPFFSRTETTVKFGIGERLTGYEEIRPGLSAQTEATTAWQIDSDCLVVVEESDHAWFSDDVFMAWTDEEAEIRYEFETRWSGTLQRQPNEPWDGVGTATPWRFVGMHVSTPGGT